ncbi:MAG: VCBS repeat-containing protein, partial [Betaproteobacteria bacterium]
MASAIAAQGVSFPTTVIYPVGSFPRSLAIADFDGDGKADLAVVNETSQTVSILLGHGDGTFTAAPSLYVLGGGFAMQVAVGDFNGDGKVDLAVTNLLGHNVAVFLGHGDGTFGTATTFSVNGAAFAVATADVNGDGKIDLVVTNAAGGTIGQTLQVLLGNGDGTFATAVSYPTEADPHWVSIGDFNGDGHLDLITANSSSNTVSLLLGRGDGTFQPPTNFATGVAPQAIAVADFNGDGDLDFAVTNSSSNSVSIHLGDGHGGFVAATSLTTGSTPTGIALCDVNGDGAPDLVVANQSGNSLSIFISNGDATFQPAVTLNLGQAPDPVAVADLNGDGKADVIAGEVYVSSVAVALNATSFPATITAQSGTPQSAPLNTAYATAMTVLVADAGNQPLPGLVVTFSAAASGASGLFAGGLRSARAI